MILAPLRNPEVEAIVRSVVRPGEQVVTSPVMVLPAALLGFPRGAVVWNHHDPVMRVLREVGIPTVELTRSGWEEQRRRSPEDGRLAMGGLLDSVAGTDTWVERLFSDLERTCGRPLPQAFRAFARRPLEYPREHQFTRQIAPCFGMTRGALNQRFVRSGVPSPGSYLQWLRVFAAAHVLGNETVTTAQAAHRLGYTSSGSLCRSIQTLGGLPTTRLRTPGARPGLLMRFSVDHLSPGHLAGWDDLASLFVAAA